MPGPTMTAPELAEELGRKTSWLYDNWRGEVSAKRLPSPLHGGTAPLTWSRAQVVAVLDRALSPAEKVAAAAFRAAAAAAAGARLVPADALAVEEARSRLDARFAKGDTL